MYQKFLVPVDGSPTSDRGLSEAIALARVLGARLRLIHVIDQVTPMSTMAGGMAYTEDMFDSMKDAGAKILAAARAEANSHGIPVEVALLDNVSGRVSELIAKEATEWGADLIVLGTHGRTGVERVLLGSDAEVIIREAPVPVLVVRAAD